MKKVFLIIILVILVLLVGGYAYLKIFERSPLPNYAENITLENLSGNVEVYRDQYGIPHIYAQSKEDLFRVLGYVMSQDRLWQMDLLRRVTQGRISEIFGEDFIDTDYQLRCLQISQKSELLWNTTDDSLKKLLIAFSDGVNQYIESNEKKLPIEFKILGYKPEKWTPQQSLNLIGYMAWDLGMAWSNEITLYKIREKLGDTLLNIFVPDFSGDLVIYDFKNIDIENKGREIGSVLSALGAVPFTGSNNWALSPQKTIDSSAFLCNDMHLGLSIPGIWYQAHLVAPGYNVSGVIIPGEPFVVAGHNSKIAWGMTNVMLDDADFYIEKINEDSTKYFCDGKWLPLKVENIEIKTDKGKIVKKKIFFTHRGPLISYFKNTDKALSMRWIGFEPSNEMLGVYLLNIANNWEDFSKAASYFGSVSQNIIYADIYGNIGIRFTGLVPKRITDGWQVFPGDTTLFDWKGFVPYDSLPYEFNPQRGFVASANNKSADSLSYYVSAYFYQDYRFARIFNFLNSGSNFSVDDMKRLQTDINSVFVDRYLKRIVKQLKELNSNVESFNKAIALLDNWDGQMAADRPEPLIFEQFYLEFIKNTVSDELGTDLFNEFFSSKILANNLFYYLWKNTNSSLFDIKSTEKKENFEDILSLSFSETLDTLTEQFGEDITAWKYGDIHRLTLSHPLGSVRILDILFNLNRGPYKVGGSHHTVCPYNYVFSDNFKVIGGASQRHIFVTHNWDSSYTIIPTGESGQPGSKNYCDQTQLYINGEYHKDIFSKDILLQNFVYKSVFYPAEKN